MAKSLTVSAIPVAPLGASIAAPTPPALMQALGHSLSDRRLQVLRALGECGSISQAARQVGVSYKAAWQAIDTLGNLAGVPVVQKSVGGAGGGGAKLTEAGHELLRAAQAMAQARGAVMQQLQSMEAVPVQAVQRLGVQTSMRNQWPCVVQSVQVVGSLAQVQLLSQGHAQQAAPMCCRITAESAQLLGLAAGMPVLALCKATAVQVLAGSPDPQWHGNSWKAKAVRVSAGDWGDEVAAQLPAGLQLVGFAPPQSGLRAGRIVHLHVPASAVVLAVV